MAGFLLLFLSVRNPSRARSCREVDVLDLNAPTRFAASRGVLRRVHARVAQAPGRMVVGGVSMPRAVERLVGHQVTMVQLGQMDGPEWDEHEVGEPSLGELLDRDAGLGERDHAVLQGWLGQHWD